MTCLVEISIQHISSVRAYYQRVALQTLTISPSYHVHDVTLWCRLRQPYFQDIIMYTQSRNEHKSIRKRNVDISTRHSLYKLMMMTLLVPHDTFLVGVQAKELQIAVKTKNCVNFSQPLLNPLALTQEQKQRRLYIYVVPLLTHVMKDNFIHHNTEMSVSSCHGYEKDLGGEHF